MSKRKIQKIKRIAINIVLCLIVVTLIFLHIKYLCWERQYFAVGGEWFVYIIAIIAVIRRFVDDN